MPLRVQRPLDGLHRPDLRGRGAAGAGRASWPGRCRARRRSPRPGPPPSPSGAARRCSAARHSAGDRGVVHDVHMQVAVAQVPEGRDRQARLPAQPAEEPGELRRTGARARRHPRSAWRRRVGTSPRSTSGAPSRAPRPPPGSGRPGTPAADARAQPEHRAAVCSRTSACRTRQFQEHHRRGPAGPRKIGRPARPLRAEDRVAVEKLADRRLDPQGEEGARRRGRPPPRRQRPPAGSSGRPGCGISFSVASVTIPSMPSLPIHRSRRLKPAANFLVAVPH